MNKDVIPASILTGVINMAVSLQISIEDLLKAAEIDPSIVGSDDAYLSSEQFSALLSALKETSGDKAFGLHYGGNGHFRSGSVVAELLYSAHTLREALKELVKYKELVVPHAQMSMAIENDMAIISYASGSVNLDKNQATYNEIILSRMISIFRWVSGDSFPLAEMRFSHVKPEYFAEYELFFDCPVTFDYPENQIVFKKDVLDMPLVSSLPDYHNRIEEKAAEQLERRVSGYKTTRKVIGYIEQNMGEYSISVESVAQYLNMTPRTLQRKLKLENTSFVEVRDRIRREKAHANLSHSSIRISSLAILLGFSDVSTFYHAFKRWEGISPGEYRKQKLEERLLDEEPVC